MQKYLTGLLLAIIVLMAGACRPNENSAERKLKQDVETFATAYFNWQLAEAAEWSTTGTKSWISYAASQLTQEDIDAINSLPAKAGCEVRDVVFESDSAARADVVVSHFMMIDTIGRQPTQKEEEHFWLRFAFDSRQNRWLAQLDGLPRPSGRQTRSEKP